MNNNKYYLGQKFDKFGLPYSIESSVEVFLVCWIICGANSKNYKLLWQLLDLYYFPPIDVPSHIKCRRYLAWRADYQKSIDGEETFRFKYSQIHKDPLQTLKYCDILKTIVVRDIKRKELISQYGENYVKFLDFYSIFKKTILSFLIKNSPIIYFFFILFILTILILIIKFIILRISILIFNKNINQLYIQYISIIIPIIIIALLMPLIMSNYKTFKCLVYSIFYRIL